MSYYEEVKKIFTDIASIAAPFMGALFFLITVLIKRELKEWEKYRDDIHDIFDKHDRNIAELYDRCKKNCMETVACKESIKSIEKLCNERHKK